MPITRSMTSASKTSASKTIMTYASKTDKNNKIKKRKTQQTLNRKVDRALKQTHHLYEELTPADYPEDKYSSLEQVSQISYQGITYELFWHPLTSKALIQIPDIQNDYSYKNVVHYEDFYFVEYDDCEIIDMIYNHFGIVHIFPNDSSNIDSSGSLYTLVSDLPLTQYTLVD